MTLKFGIFPVLSFTVKLCDEAKKMGFSCPLAANTYDAKMTVMLPGAIPGVSQRIFLSCTCIAYYCTLKTTIYVAFPIKAN